MSRIAVLWPESSSSVAVQLGVHVRRAEEVALLEQRTLTGETFSETRTARLVDAPGGTTHSEALEDGACLQDLDGFLVVDAPHPRAPVGSRTTSPSCSRRMSAVRTAPRDMSNVVEMSTSTRRASGAMSPRTIASRRAS